MQVGVNRQSGRRPALPSQLSEDGRRPGDLEPCALEEDPVAWIIRKHLPDSSVERGRCVTRVVDIASSQPVGLRKSEHSECCRKAFVGDHSDLRRRGDQLSHRICRRLWRVTRHRLFLREVHVDLTQDAGGCGSRQFASSRRLDNGTGFFVAGILVEKCGDENPRVKEDMTARLLFPALDQ